MVVENSKNCNFPTKYMFLTKFSLYKLVLINFVALNKAKIFPRLNIYESWTRSCKMEVPKKWSRLKNNCKSMIENAQNMRNQYKCNKPLTIVLKITLVFDRTQKFLPDNILRHWCDFTIWTNPFESFFIEVYIFSSLINKKLVILSQRHLIFDVPI
jgi:hypothetical protein